MGGKGCGGGGGGYLTHRLHTVRATLAGGVIGGHVTLKTATGVKRGGGGVGLTLQGG